MFKFYLADAYSKGEERFKDMQYIEQASGWHCTSRWLKGDLTVDYEKASWKLCAEHDVADVMEADALVICSGASTHGGKWVELGLAIALQKLIYFVRWHPDSNPPVFAYLDQVKVVTNMDEVIKELSIEANKRGNLYD